VTWSAFVAAHLLAIVAAAVLVGFAEETLFRGIILRALRGGRRPEGLVVLFSSLWFGFFHLSNLVVGAGISVIQQSIIASLAGVRLYLARLRRLPRRPDLDTASRSQHVGHPRAVALAHLVDAAGFTGL
jgi:membrane protease YdiL (CAAX protease family)